MGEVISDKAKIDDAGFMACRECDLSDLKVYYEADGAVLIECPEHGTIFMAQETR